jgi:tetratricopeptide (TPR) repeat protein
MQGVADEFPTIEGNHGVLGWFSFNLIDVLPYGKQRDELMRRTFNLTVTIAANDPYKTPAALHNLRACHQRLAGFWAPSAGKEANWHQRMAVELSRQLRSKYSDKKEYHDRLVNDLGFLALDFLYQPDVSVRSPRRAIELIEEGRGIDNTYFDKNFGQIVGLAYYRLGDWENALRHLELVQKKPSGDGADVQYALAMTASRLGDKKRALEHFARGEKQWKEYRGRVEEMKNTIWSTSPVRGEAAALLGVNEFVTYLDRFYLARGYREKGDQEQALKWYKDAVQWLEKNDPKDDRVYRAHAETEILLGLRPAPVFEEPTAWPPTATSPAKVGH